MTGEEYRKEIDRLMGMHEEKFNHEMSAHFRHKLGEMRLASTRHAYPLVTVYSKRGRTALRAGW